MDNAIIRELISRYLHLTPNSPHNKFYISMKILSAHKAHPLQLEMLLLATDGDIIHDVEGITKNFDSATKQYRNDFWPRYSAQCAVMCTHTEH